MSKKILISHYAAKANRYIFSKKPSDIVPFKGKFPIVEDYKLSDYNDEILNKEYLEDCSEWVQKVVIAGELMHSIDTGFKEYLNDSNISIEDFEKKPNSEKANELIRYFNSRSLSLDALNISI